MSADLFVVRDVDTAARSRQSSLVIASIVVHAAAFGAMVVVSILLPGLLPAPHSSALAWDAGPTMVRITDIPLPPPPPAKRPEIAPVPASANAAPIEAPTGISEEPASAGTPAPEEPGI